VFALLWNSCFWATPKRWRPEEQNNRKTGSITRTLWTLHNWVLIFRESRPCRVFDGQTVLYFRLSMQLSSKFESSSSKISARIPALNLVILGSVKLFIPAEHLIFQFNPPEKITVDIGAWIHHPGGILFWKPGYQWRANVITHTRIIRGFWYKVHTWRVCGLCRAFLSK